MSSRPRVGLFVTCLVDLIRPRIGFAAIRLLDQAGFDVDVPRTQTCCGQPAWNSGDDRNARAIARQVVDAFEGFDYVVAPSGSCAGMMRVHYPEVLAADPAYLPRAKALAQKTWELVSFLVRIRGVNAIPATFGARICYHDSCSSLREMRVSDEPRTLLKSVKGLELHELRDREVCCGFGGLFSVKYPEISERMADDKISDAQNAGADVIASADLGCLLHLEGRIARRRLKMRTMHIAEILAGPDDSVP